MDSRRETISGIDRSAEGAKVDDGASISKKCCVTRAEGEVFTTSSMR